MPRARSRGTSRAAATPTTTFAVAPALAITGIIDMGSTEGRKMYKDGTESIADPLFGLVSNGLKLFLSGIRRRARLYGWTSANGIMMIPEDPSIETSPRHNLVTEYGEITAEMIQDYDATYMGKDERRYQDNCMLFECLMNSIDEKAKRRIALKEHEYLVGGEASGTQLLKTIIKTSRLDTTASENLIRERLSNLDEHMKTIEGHNISTFNDYVRDQVDALAARGAVSTDLLINLFKGYLSVSDHRFNKYIEEKQSSFEDGTTYTEDELMDLAETRYELLQDKGVWNKPSADQEQLLLMKAQLETMKAATTKTNKTNKRKRSDKDERSEDRSNYRGKNFKPAPEWKAKQERPNDLSTKNWWIGRWWYYCCSENGGKCPGRWVCHEPSKCEGRAFRRTNDDGPHQEAHKDNKEPKKDVKKERTTSNRKDKMVKAISAELNDDSGDDSSNASE